MPNHITSYPLEDEINMSERLQQHRNTGGVYMRSIRKTNAGVKPMCHKCYQSLQTAIKPLEPVLTVRRHES